MAEAPVCPQCGSEKLYRDGFRYLSDGSPVQRWLCRDCGFRFSENAKNNSRGKEVSGAHQNHGRLLVEVEKQLERREAGAKEATEQEVKGKIIGFLWHLEKNGRSSVTIENYRKFFNGLLRHGLNLFNPEEVKGYIAKARWNVSSKIAAVRKLNVWFRFLKVEWEPPKYTPEGSIPFIPTEQEVDLLISAVGKKNSCVPSAS